MEIWIAIVIEHIGGPAISEGEPVPIEHFISEEECLSFVKSPLVWDAFRESGEWEDYKFYFARCEPVPLAVS